MPWWKYTMPPAQFAPQLRERFLNTPSPDLGEGKLQPEVRGFDWMLDWGALFRLARMRGQWKLNAPLYVELFDPDADREKWIKLLGYIKGATIGIHPLQDIKTANETLWHEIQHAYQDQEGRQENMETYVGLPNWSTPPEAYSEHPIETDANDFASQMSPVPLLIPAENYYNPRWVPNELHLDRGEWDDQQELWLLTPDQLKAELDAMVKMFRTERWRWQRMWVTGDEEDAWFNESSTDDDLGWVTADYNGWTNWETWNTKLMMDNERELYDASRKLVEKYENDMEQGIRALENWTVQQVIGPANAQAIQDAQEWNDIPEDERIDYNYEDLKEKSQDAADFADAIGFGKDVSDVDPTIIDPNLVNWIEIWNSITEEIEENRAYEEEKRKNPPKIKPLGPVKFQVGQRVVIVTPGGSGGERAKPGTYGTIIDNSSSWQNSFGDTGRIYSVQHDDGRVTNEYEGGLRLMDEPNESGLYVGATVGYEGTRCKIIDGPYDDSSLGGRAWRIAPLSEVRNEYGSIWYAKNALESELTPLEGPLDPEDTQPGDLTLPEGPPDKWTHAA